MGGKRGPPHCAGAGNLKLGRRLLKIKVDGSGVNAPESGIGLNPDEQSKNILTDPGRGCRAPCVG